MAKKKMTTTAPAKYILELGLDSNVAPRSDGTYPYLMSLVKVDDWNAPPPGTPAWFTGFNSGDQIAFRACDYTAVEVGMPVVDVKSIVVSFLEPENPRCLSPCISDGVICSGQNYFPILEGKSLLLDSVQCWRFVDSPKSTVDKIFSLTGKYRALLRVSIAATVMVGAVKELRWFTHDPEIIVGEGSGEPPRRRQVPRRRKG